MGDGPGPASLAKEIDRAIRALPRRDAASERGLRREYSKRLADRPAEYVLDLARRLVSDFGWRGAIPYELVRYHRAAFGGLDRRELEALGRGMGSWHDTDCFGRILSGPAWVRGRIGLGTVRSWARSKDLWWRRAALVTTVGLNSKVSGGTGDARSTLAICRMLVEDREDMVVKALSWALRELVDFEPDAVEGFLGEHGDRVAARVRRETRNKLETGRKHPRRGGGGR